VVAPLTRQSERQLRGRLTTPLVQCSAEPSFRRRRSFEPPPHFHTHTRRSCAAFRASASWWDLPASLCLLAPKTRLASASDFTSFRLLAYLLLALHAAVAVAAFAITCVVWFFSFFFFFWFWFWFFLGSLISTGVVCV